MDEKEIERPLMRGNPSEARVIVPFHKGGAGLCGSTIIAVT